MPVNTKRIKREGNKEDASTEAIQALAESRESKISQAIKLLSEQYFDRLQLGDFNAVVDALSSESKARVWLALGRQILRDN